MSSKIQNKSNKLPLKNHVMHKMSSPNEDILIYKGTIYIKANGITYSYNDAKITLKWKPSHKYVWDFIPKSEAAYYIESSTSSSGKLLQVGINGIDFNEASLYAINDEVYSIATHIVEIGKKPVKFKEVGFDLPNFKNVCGEPVRNGLKISSDRVSIITDKINITIDLVEDNSNVMKILRYKEGILVNARCKMNFKKRLSFKQMTSECHCFSYFISFVLGRWTSVFCIEVDESFKFYYSPYIQSFQYDSDKFSNFYNDNGLNQAYSNFSNLWADPLKTTFIKKVIEWYTEISIKQVQHEIGIILAQTTLEFMYNYIIQKDIDKLGSEKKIRTILQHFKVDTRLPAKYEFIAIEYFKSRENIDGVYLLTSFRNAFVHGNPKMSHLRSAELKVIYMIYDLATAYIEMVMINLLDIKLTLGSRLKDF